MPVTFFLIPCRYFLICPTKSRVKSINWIASHLPTDGSVAMHDISDQYVGLNVLGPKARNVLQKLTSTINCSLEK